VQGVQGVQGSTGATVRRKDFDEKRLRMLTCLSRDRPGLQAQQALLDLLAYPAQLDRLGEAALQEPQASLALRHCRGTSSATWDAMRRLVLRARLPAKRYRATKPRIRLLGTANAAMSVAWETSFTSERSTLGAGVWTAIVATLLHM
jgi:hypothetical protein